MRPWLLRDPDDPGGGGGGGGTEGDPPDGDPKPKGDPPEDGDDTQANWLDQLPEDAQKAIRELRDENAKHRKRAKEAESQREKLEREAEAARQKKLEEEGKYQELNTELKSRTEAQEATIAELTEALEATLQAQLDAVPDRFVALIPEGMSALEKLNYINTPAFRELVQSAAKKAAPGAKAPVNGDDARAKKVLEDLEERARKGDIQAHAQLREMRLEMAGKTA